MSRTFFYLRRKRGYGSRHPVPGQIGVTLESCVLPLWSGVLLCSISAAACFISNDNADRVLKLASSRGCTVSTMVLSETRGLELFRVIRGGIGLTQRLSATGTVCLQAFGILALEPERLKNRQPSPLKIREDGRGSSPRCSSGLRFQFVSVEVFSLLP